MISIGEESIRVPRERESEYKMKPNMNLAGFTQSIIFTTIVSLWV